MDGGAYTDVHKYTIYVYIYIYTYVYTYASRFNVRHDHCENNNSDASFITAFFRETRHIDAGLVGAFCNRCRQTNTNDRHEIRGNCVGKLVCFVETRL